MNLQRFRKVYGWKGAAIAGKRVPADAPAFDARQPLCRLCSERLACARVESLLLDGLSFLAVERSTSVPDTSVVRHFENCLSPEVQQRIKKAQYARRHCLVCSGGYSAKVAVERLGGKTFEQVAAICGVSESTVRRHFRLCARSQKN
jgi:hypothetical protein